MQYLEIVLILGLLSVVIILAWRVFRYRLYNRPLPPIQHRMMVAIRRRAAGIARFLEMESEKQDQLLDDLQKQMWALHARWQDFGEYAGGFSGFEMGLPSGGEDDWSILAMYDLESDSVFSKCKAVLEDERYTLLRNHFDIRLIKGEDIDDPSIRITELF